MPNAIDTLRETLRGALLNNEDEAFAALTRVEALLQAAEAVVRTHSSPTNKGGGPRMEALAAAVLDVKGDTPEEGKYGDWRDDSSDYGL